MNSRKLAIGAVTRRLVRFAGVLSLALFVLGSGLGLAEAANTYTISLPGGSGVTMAVPSTLNFTVTNTGNANTISEVALRFNKNNYTIANGTAPSGWTVNKITNQVGNKIEIKFRTVDQTTCASAIGLGQSLVFGVDVTGGAAAADVTNDTLDNGTALKNNCTGNTFTLQGSFPTWRRRGLEASLSATPSSVGTGATITVTMNVTNRSSAAQNVIVPSALTASPGGLVGAPSGPSPASMNLAAGASGSFTWTVTALSSGVVSFSASASNASVTSATATSNSVTIAALAALLSVSPDQVVSGQQVTVTMTVTNNGGTSLSNVRPAGAAPSITPIGSATETYVSGPTPASVASLAPGASANFSWTYTITGSTGQTYIFQGSGTADGPVNSNTATSNTGTISAYTVTVSPDIVTAGQAGGAALVFTVFNNGGFAVDRVTVSNPDKTKWVATDTSNNACGAPSPGWGAAGWSYTFKAGNPEKYQFDACSAGDQITTGGGQKALSTTFNPVPNPANDTTYSFTVEIRDTNGTKTNIGVDVLVTKYVLTISASPATIGADGQSTSTVTATLTKSGTPQSGQTITFVTTSGTLSASQATTNASGQATVTLTAPVSESDIVASVTADYLTLDATTAVTFQRVVLTISASPGTIGADGQSTSTITVTLTQGGAALSGATVTLATSAGTLSATSLTTNASGQATATLTASVSETDVTATETATYKGHVKTTSVTFQRVVLTVSASPGTIGADGQSTSTITVTLTQGGSALSGATVTLATTAGTLSATTLTTNASGQATSILTASVSETDVTATETATYKGHVKTTTVTFQRVVLAISASPTSIPANGTSTSTITVTLTQGGAALSGATVTLSTSAGTLSATTLTTNASGQATATLTSVSSGSNVTATVTGTYKGHVKTTSVTFGVVVTSVLASPATIGADGQSTSTITVTLTLAGAPWSGQVVSLSTTAGTLSASSVTTNASGQGTATLTASVSETNVTATVTASYPGWSSATTTVTFQGVVLTVSASPGTIAADGQSTSTITVTLTQGGSALSGATVTLSTSAGTLSATSLTTNASGQATATLTASVSETDVTATEAATYKGHVKTTSVTFQRVVLTLSASPGTIGADGQSTSTITVTLTQGGAALSGATVTLSTSAGTLSATTLTTNASGQATATLTASVSETDVTATETATYKGHVKTTTVTFQAVVLTLSASPSSIPADGVSTSTITITLTQGGSALSGATVTLSTSAGTLSATTLTTNGSGQATATLTSVSSGSNVTATVTGTYKGHVKTTSVLFGAIAISIGASPGTIGADGQSTSTITVTLTYGGSPYSGQTVSLSTTAGTLSATSLTTNASGQATSTLTAPVSTTNSTATVTAQYLGPAFQAQTTVTFLGVALSIAASPADVDGDGEATTTLTITLTQGGTGLSGATVTLTTTDGTLSPSSVTTNASGQATATLTAPVSTLSKSVTITATYRAVVTTAAINIKGISLSITAAPPTIGADGQSQSTITVTLTRDGSPYSGKTVTLSTTAGTLSATSLTTNGSGQATATLTSVVSETDVTATVTANYKALSPTATVFFQRVLLTISASPTTIPADGASTSTITVTLTQGGSAVSGATISLATSAGTLSATTLTTNGSGQATATLTAVSSATDVTATVTATYKAVSKQTSVIFRGVALSLSASPTSIAADGVTTSTLTATLTAGGSGLSGKSVSFSTTAGTLSASSATTNGSGQATVTLTSSVSKTNVTATITATYTSFTGTATVTFTGITISEVGYLSAVAGNGQVTLYWENPSQYFTETVVVRKGGSAPAADPADGTSYAVGGVLADGSEVIYKGATTTAAQAGLTNGTTYYYKAYTAYSSSPLYSSGTVLDVTPSAGGAGQPSWEYAVAGGNLQSGAVLDFTGGVYLSAGTSRFMGLQDGDGAHLWTPAQAQDTLLTGITWAPVSGTGFATAYLVGGDGTGQAYAVNPATGAILWQVTLPGAEALQALPMQQMWEYSDATYQAQYGPSVTDLVFFISRNSSTTNNRIYAVRLSDGAVVWEFNTGGGANVDGAIGSPVVDASQNRIYVPTRAGAGGQSSLWTLSTLDGSLVGSLALGHIEASVNVSYDWNTLYVGATGGTLYAVDLAGGAPAVRWSYASGGALTGFVWEDFYTPGLLYLATQDGNIVALQDSGTAAPPTPVWQTAIAGPSTPLLLDTTMVVGSSDGRLYEVRLSDGVITGSVVVGAGSAAVGDPATPDGVTVVVGTTAGKLYRYTTPLP